MTHGFDKDYWDQHWQDRTGGTGSMAGNPPNPYLARELADLVPGTALDAGCGAGAEALWLAAHGWQVTAADISAEALALAADRATAAGAEDRVRWVEADLGVWTPDSTFDLVTTHYAHPAVPQLDFYSRLASWVAPGGTLLVVGHLHTHGHGGHGEHGHGDGPPAEASVTAAAVTARLDDAEWTVVTAAELQRTLPGAHGHGRTLDDVVVRATRRP
ncbi:class I SAM-dependent methyltransferase [Modestobacter muralis]|uniref:Class I SAM-dependent methyltransferase n=1 Tax=Modestobacter muralis TaxID=1608614 RepID=A0A6P0HAC0_9ACTN|nr:class I SAM-dependent methyltransferase [Modestobacter muralis]NEK95487.1 class I SAM-dependent methyltransferase [Modestobacter muralis]NEN52375.1 class I SAM-dependent methyltransferase [Modestobacter muralis]